MLFKKSESEETRQIKLILFVGLAFLISGWLSCGEIKYMVWGQQGEATVTSVKKVANPSRHGRREVIAVQYAWSEKGGLHRKDVMNMNPESAPARGDKLSIDYLPGAKGSRLRGQANYVALVFFFGLLAVMAFVVIRLVRVGSR